MPRTDGAPLRMTPARLKHIHERRSRAISKVVSEAIYLDASKSLPLDPERADVERWIADLDEAVRCLRRFRRRMNNARTPKQE